MESYRTAMDVHYDALSAQKSERAMETYKQRVENLVESDANSVRREQHILREKLTRIISRINKTEENLERFTGKGAESIRKQYEQSMEVDTARGGRHHGNAQNASYLACARRGKREQQRRGKAAPNQLERGGGSNRHRIPFMNEANSGRACSTPASMRGAARLGVVEIPQWRRVGYSHQSADPGSLPQSCCRQNLRSTRPTSRCRSGPLKGCCLRTCDASVWRPKPQCVE